MITRLQHGRVELALHRLRDGDTTTPLLLLHPLGSRTPEVAPNWSDRWPGPVFGLDFTGHGASTVPRGGGYSAEVLLADVDTALTHLGAVSIVGRGLGGYVGLLAAGARPSGVRGVVIDDGPGLTGGGTMPSSPSFVAPVFESSSSPDPFALQELSRDIRPPDYVRNFARFALEGSPAAEPIIVSARILPAWLEAVADEHGVVRCSFEAAVERLGR